MEKSSHSKFRSPPGTALPEFVIVILRNAVCPTGTIPNSTLSGDTSQPRSEERRVGKECRGRGAAYVYKEKSSVSGIVGANLIMKPVLCPGTRLNVPLRDFPSPSISR